MIDTAWALIVIAVIQTVLLIPTFVRELRSMQSSASSGVTVGKTLRLRRPVIVMVIAALASWGAAAFDIYGKDWIGSPPPYTSAWLTPARKEIFKQATYSVSDAWATRTRVVSISAAASTQNFAEALVDLFILSGFQPKDQSGGRGGGRPYWVGTEEGYRFKPGITIVGPVPDATVEAVRVAFERIGIRTERGRDDSSDHFTVEVGPPPS